MIAYINTTDVHSLLINIGFNGTFFFKTSIEPVINTVSLVVKISETINKIMFGFLNHTPHKTKFSNILSASGSSNAPIFEIALYFRAIYPSKKSLMAPKKINIRAINLCSCIKKNTEIKADIILNTQRTLGTNFIKDIQIKTGNFPALSTPN